MNTTNYISLHEVLSRLKRHPMLQDVTKEQVVSYLIDFIAIWGFPETYTHKEDIIDIVDYRGLIPCNVVSIDFVKDCSGTTLRAMTDVWTKQDSYDHTWKIQGNVLYTSFKEGRVFISYSTIPVDDDGFPLLLENSLYIKSFELYVKKEIFGVYFETGKIPQNILTKVEQDYSWSAGQLRSEMTMPDISQIESIKNMLTSAFPKDNHFSAGFKSLGNENLMRIH